MIYIRDLNHHGYCSKGVRAFFKRYNLSYSELLKNGISEEEIRKTNDGLALDFLESYYGWKKESNHRP